MSEWIHAFEEWLLEFGSWGLFFVSFLESSFFPIPPDVLMIPMGIADLTGHCGTHSSQQPDLCSEHCWAGTSVKKLAVQSCVIL
ncbi:hypothetical protein [Mesobacillus boroniphilus]|uniref:hypothetical protein n=1 Tax=Mesobacillus boroniphilus TaxID=308892 RepID=UPI0034E1A505